MPIRQVSTRGRALCYAEHMTPPPVDSPRTVAASPEIAKVHDVSGVWRLRADWRGRLFAAEAPDWFRLHDDRRAALVKQGRGRSVWRVELGENVVFAKVVQPGSGLQRVKALLLGDPARREWKALEACAMRGVPVPEAIGWGSQPGCRTSVVITRAIEPAQTFLDAWMEATKSAADRRARTMLLIHAAATLFATAHERGVWHRDAHAGNILVSAVDAECRAYFTDMLGARFRRGALDWKESMESLAQFDQRMRRVATRVERLRFLQEYLDLRETVKPASRVNLRQFLSEKARVQHEYAERFARAWDRRLGGDGKYFARVRMPGGWSGVVALRAERPHVHKDCAITDRTVEQWKSVLQGLVEPNLVGEKKAPWAVDSARHTAKSSSERFAWTVFGSPARRAFMHAHISLHRDRTAPPLPGYLERRRCGFTVECLLLDYSSPS